MLFFAAFRKSILGSHCYYESKKVLTEILKAFKVKGYTTIKEKIVMGCP